MTGARKFGLEKRDGYDVGRDPREISHDELRQMGHKPMSALKAMRLKCLDCAESVGAVRRCADVACPIWPFRMGKTPWPKPISPAQLAQVRGLAARSAAKVQNQRGPRGISSASDFQVPTQPNAQDGAQRPLKRAQNPEGAK